MRLQHETLPCPFRGLILGLFLLSLEMGGIAQNRQESPDSGSLRGRVREQRGKALPGVKIEAVRKGDPALSGDDGNRGETKIVETDTRGEFLLVGLLPGEYVLSFSRPGYRTFTTRTLTVAPGETVRLSRIIELSREESPYAIIRGAIFQGVGFTMPNALVTLERIDGRRKGSQKTISREGGEFAFRLRAEPATYRITASSPGWKTASLEVEIELDEVRNIAIVLEPLP
jgi:hypothetical protein